jgi:hypothetical protein
MALCSRHQIGAFNAESFIERVLSEANLVMSKGNALLGIALLLINRNFMKYM